MGIAISNATSTNNDITFAPDQSTGNGTKINPTTIGNNNSSVLQNAENATNLNANNSTVNMTDFGAISRGMDVATAALEAGKDSVKNALSTGAGFVSDSLKYNSDALKSSLDFANTQASKSIDQMSTLNKATQAANAATVDKVLALTESVKTDGATQQNKLVAYIAGGLLLSAVLIVAAIQWGKK